MDKSQTLTVTAADVLEGAKKSESAKAVLKAMFPEVFYEDDKYFHLWVLSNGDGTLSNNLVAWRDCGLFCAPKRPAIQVRISGNFHCKGFYLSCDFNWEIIRDDHGELVLVPTKKA